MATVLRRLRLKRVSLVDSPANEEARVVLFKSEHTKQQPTSSEVHVDEMVDCKKCGASVAKGASKCPKCGYEMRVQKAPERPEEDAMDADKLKADLDAANAKLAETLAKERDALQKQLDTPEAIEKRKLDAMPASVRERIEKSEAKVKKLEDEASEREMVEVIKGTMQALPGKYDENGKLLKRFKDAVSPEDFDALSTMLKAASAQIEKGGLFREVGKGGDGEPAALSPMARIEQKVAEFIAKDDKLTRDAALSQVFAADPALYRAYTKSVTFGHRSADDAEAN
jgi:ribosomal protein L40E